jgi:hypothetical protein
MNTNPNQFLSQRAALSTSGRAIATCWRQLQVELQQAMPLRNKASLRTRSPKWSATCLALICVLPLARRTRAADNVHRAEMAGYLIVPHGKVPESYNAGFSMYSAAWPLLKIYPGSRFQSGLLGTWMFAQYSKGRKPAKMYSDVEGGLGWWNDTRFGSEAPKFHMGGVAPNFSAWANGPGAGKGDDWERPAGQYGVAQLSPWLLFPPDGLNLKQGTCGGLFGYGYLALPLTEPKATTDGKNIPTGNNCWTLFLNTGNFKGPVAFFTPYFWSHGAVAAPRLAGLLLDSRPAAPNRAIQMETQYIPADLSTDLRGHTYARVTPIQFPVTSDDESVVLNRVLSYNKKALWDTVDAWFKGGPAASGAIDPGGAGVYTFRGDGGATWSIDETMRNRAPIAWNSMVKPVAPDSITYGYRWNGQLVTKEHTPNGSLVELPQYYRLITRANGRPEWVPVKAEDVPAETGLAKVKFARPEEHPEPYVTPEDPQSCWKKPGPAAGPFQAHPGDGSTVTYYWYRFADQPALLNADMTPKERENLQKRVEMIQRNWTKDRNYLPPPTIGKLADIDPALLVTPPKGMEVGYVPIATRQDRPPNH